MKRSHVPLALVVLIIASTVHGMFMMPSLAPIDRLIANTTAYIKEHPKDAQGYYVLGRVHALAAATKLDAVPTYRPGDGKTLPDLGDADARGRPAANGAAPVKLDPDAVRQHVFAGLENFDRAIALDGQKPEFHVSRAYLLDIAAADALDLGPPPAVGAASRPSDAATTAPALVDPALKEKVDALIARLADPSFDTREKATHDLIALGPAAAPVVATHAKDGDAETSDRCKRIVGAAWRDAAIDEYWTAYSLARSQDVKIKNQPLSPRGMNSLVSYEAGNAYTRLVTARGPTEAEKKRLADVEKTITTLKGKPMGAITPIIFALDRARPLDDLLAPPGAETKVKFDLDGTGSGADWPWVKPTTGILVWDPRGDGRIASGRQLFGSVTFQMFWHDGYHALDSLDDNRDGQLEGKELDGLAVWFDRNGNGVSDPGEVVPIETLGIKSIAARATSKSTAAPANSAGITMQDGRVLPTYDWVTQPTEK